MMDILELLSLVSVINKDNGTRFLDSGRLDVIGQLLWDSPYRRINPDGLFHLYAKKPLQELNKNVVIVSTHVDCAYSMTECFSARHSDELLRGTYDNAITNAAVLSLMLSDCLPDNVLIAFTGDEEENSKGAAALTAWLRRYQFRVRHIFVLDVTDMGWTEEVDFTIENDFWADDVGRQLIAIAESAAYKWKFVPEDLDDIPAYVRPAYVIPEEAEADESWEYDERDIPCCSLCIPVDGDMHSNAGVFARTSSFRRYTEILSRMLNELK